MLLKAGSESMASGRVELCGAPLQTFFIPFISKGVEGYGFWRCFLLFITTDKVPPNILPFRGHGLCSRSQVPRY